MADPELLAEGDAEPLGEADPLDEYVADSVALWLDDEEAVPVGDAELEAEDELDPVRLSEAELEGDAEPEPDEVADDELEPDAEPEGVAVDVGEAELLWLSDGGGDTEDDPLPL